MKHTEGLHGTYEHDGITRCNWCAQPTGCEKSRYELLETLIAIYRESDGGQMKPWSTYLAPDSELERIKEVVNAVTRILKQSNDEAANIPPPRTAEEWKAYGKRNPNW